MLLATAFADVIFGETPLRPFAAMAAVAVAAAATLASVAVAERSAAVAARRWQVQALACAVLMLALMAEGPGTSDGPGDAALVSVAILLAATGAARLEGARWQGRAVRLALDATIVAAASGLVIFVILGEPGETPLASALPPIYAGAGYAVLVATRRGALADALSADALLLGGTIAIGTCVVGGVASGIGLPALGALEAPGLSLVGAAALLGSAAQGLLRPLPIARAEAREDSRLRFAPAVAAVLAILLLSAREATGSGSRLAFFGTLGLFALIVTRQVATLVENRSLLRSVERSGAFEERLRDLGAALVAAFDRREALELVVRTAHVSFGADSVLLWMCDPSTREIEVAEALSPKRPSILGRRTSVDDESSLAARVIRTGEAELISSASTSGQSNPFLNVLLKSQSLLAVPIVRGQVVQGALVCVDSRSPQAYGPQDVKKAELLASHAAVALDNAYQHDLQRRRLEEMTALYQFAQSAHTANSATEIARQVLPILKERLHYAYAAVWLRDRQTGTVRLAAGDSPGGIALAGSRPSPLAMEALSTGQPVHAGLGWVEADADYLPPRSGIRSQLAVPMVLGKRIVGVVDLESRQQNAYSINDERLLVSVANHAALAVDNLHLVEETRQVAALKELDRLKTELLGTVSHELRTPLGSIKGYATTLLAHEHKLHRAERREFLEIIDSEADRLTEMIENLLDLSRLEAGVLRMDPAWVRLGDSAREIARKVQLASPSHSVELVWPEDTEVWADGKRLYQVMQNLVTNAVKYSPDGGRIALEGRFNGRLLQVTVSDQGLGIPARELDRIFDRFHRVGGEVARKVGGTGLGLAICKAFVEAHGGRIWAESGGEGKGSQFHFTLPVTPRPGPHDH